MEYKKTISLVLIILLILFFVAIVYLNQKGNIEKQFVGKSLSVVLTEKGFSPANMNVHKGDTVVFSTSRGVQFWPASNPHPTHDIYPEFDPLEPINPNKTWSFKFDKVRSWKYHDHLAPYFRAKIVVLDQ